MTNPPAAPGAITGRVLDIPAIIDLAAGRTRYMAAVAYRANQRGDTLAVPAAAFAQAVSEVDADQQQLLQRALEHAIIIAPPLLETGAEAVGELGRTLRLNVPAAHVAYIARTRAWPIIARGDDAPTWQHLGFDVDPLP